MTGFSTQHGNLNVSNNAFHDLISNDVLDIFTWVVYVTLTQIIDIFGTMTNMINIVCFVKQGFKDVINISLLGLAVSDLGCLLSLVWMNICYNPAFNQLDLPFDAMEVQYLTGGWPHVIFTRVTSCITAFITLERCLCITMPLKVKMIFTHRRVTAIIICIFAVLIINMAPVYYVNRLVWKSSPSRNKTIYGLVFTINREQVEAVSFALNNLFVHFSAFLTVFISTSIIVIKLRHKSKWRQNSTASVQMETRSQRDQKVTKMIITISVCFIVCYIPIGALAGGIILQPEISMQGQYRNVFIVCCGVGFLLESINSSSNIFIYYHMSTKFRDAFRSLFAKQI